MDLLRNYIKAYWIYAAVIYTLIALIIFGSVVLHPTTSFIGGSGDSQQTMWFMGWFWNAVIHGHNPFLNPFINYPYGINMMSNASIIMEAIIFGPLALIVNSAFAYNMMMFVNLLCIALLGMAILIQMGIRKWLAVLGGILFEIMPYTSGHLLGHANLTVTSFIFGIVYMIIRLIKGKIERPLRFGLILGCLCTAQFYTSVEVTASFAFVMLIGLAWSLIIWRKPVSDFLKQISPKLYLAAAGITLVCTSPGIFMFIWGSHAGAINQPENVLVNDFLNIFIPTPVYSLHSHVTDSIASQFTGNYAEINGYLGVIALVLILWSVQRLWNIKYSRILAFWFVTVLILSFGPYLHILGHTTKLALPWIAIQKIPFIKLALPSRLMLFGDILAVIIIVSGFENLMRSGVEKWRVVNVTIASVCMIALWFPIIPFPHSKTPSSFVEISNGSVLKDLKGYPTLVYTDSFAPLMQAFADGKYAFPVANVYAYQDNSPSAFAYRPSSLTDFMSNLSYDQLKKYVSGSIASTGVKRVLYVSLANSKIPADLLSTINSICGEPINQSNGLMVWNVPSHIDTVWFEGDVWPIANFDDAQWVGKDWSIHTDKSVSLTIIAPTKEYIPSGITVTISDNVSSKNLQLIPGQSQTLTIEKNTHFHSNQKFIPDQVMTEKGDKRELSMLIKMVRVKDK